MMNITRHNLALLTSLSALLDERNVTKAAVRLGLSQPALSSQLATLRDIFGDPLLTPAISGKGMVLTPRGAHLREPLRQALQALEDVVNNDPVFDPLTAQRIFTVGGNDNASAIMAPRLVQLVRDNSLSGIRFSFRTIDKNKLAEQLENGEIDVALVSKDGLIHGPQQQLFEDEFCMAQRKGHPRGTASPSIQEYAALEHVIVSSSGGGYRGFIDDILEQHNLSRRVSVSTQYYSLVPLILQATDLVCTLPARFLERYSDALVSTSLPFEARRFSLYAIWHERFDKDPSHAWLRKQLMFVVQSQD